MRKFIKKNAIYFVNKPNLEQAVNGFPEKPLLQVQIGLWLKTLQLAFNPQTLLHGSMQLLFLQAFSNGHSELIVHSGRQPGGVPVYCDLQVHTACSFLTRHSLFGPHTLRLQGFV